jgi:hypothetical protein
MAMIVSHISISLCIIVILIILSFFFYSFIPNTNIEFADNTIALKNAIKIMSNDDLKNELSRRNIVNDICSDKKIICENADIDTKNNNSNNSLNNPNNNSNDNSNYNNSTDGSNDSKFDDSDLTYQNDSNGSYCKKAKNNNKDANIDINVLSSKPATILSNQIILY